VQDAAGPSVTKVIIHILFGRIYKETIV